MHRNTSMQKLRHRLTTANTMCLFPLALVLVLAFASALPFILLLLGVEAQTLAADGLRIRVHKGI